MMMPAFIFIIALLLISMQYKQLRAFVSDKPMQLAAVPESPDAEKQVQSRIHGFFNGNDGDTLSLTAEEVTHLSRTSQVLAEQHLDYHFELGDTVLIARNSLPVSSMKGAIALIAKLLRVHGYLNSEMRGYPDLKDGKITVVPTGAVMNGMPAPVSVLNQKGPIDVKDWVKDKPYYDKALASLASIKIREGRLLLIRKS
jgi:hypothetical protein